MDDTGPFTRRSGGSYSYGGGERFDPREGAGRASRRVRFADPLDDLGGRGGYGSIPQRRRQSRSRERRNDFGGGFEERGLEIEDIIDLGGYGGFGVGGGYCGGGYYGGGMYGGYGGWW